MNLDHLRKKYQSSNKQAQFNKWTKAFRAFYFVERSLEFSKPDIVLHANDLALSNGLPQHEFEDLWLLSGFTLDGDQIGLDDESPI